MDFTRTVGFTSLFFSKNLKQMANALSQEKLNEESLIRIFWPRERCNLLRDDVVFVDSPGVDVSKNLDDWIDNHCVNADVFVLVLNAESTMTLAVSKRKYREYIDSNESPFASRKSPSSTQCPSDCRNPTSLC